MINEDGQAVRIRYRGDAQLILQDINDFGGDRVHSHRPLYFHHRQLSCTDRMSRCMRDDFLTQGLSHDALPPPIPLYLLPDTQLGLLPIRPTSEDAVNIIQG